jgi:site-specific DNA recombinase
MSRRRVKAEQPTTRKRCAIYTRKSTEEGLAQEFNSLDAQREAAEAFVASQKSEGWTILPERYDDGGFTGGNTERPALQRLLADIAAGKVDCVVVYKVDRLSRSLLDFARMMEVFERHSVSFVSVTQQFNTSHSMGRLTLNILLSFAQFEREIIGERIRDKLAAQRRKGKWAGGKPVLGYDVDRSGASPKLVVNHDEAARVRAIFDLYFERGSMLPVVMELARRGWANKSWTTRGGKPQGGRQFDRPTLHSLLTNPIYAGRIIHKGEEFPGEHAAIVTSERFAEVQRRLADNGRRGHSATGPRRDVLLRGLLRCKACGCSMIHVLAGSGSKRYRYYVCSKANRTSRAACPAKSLPAAQIERAVIDELRSIVRDPALVKATVAAARAAATTEVDRLNEALAAITKSGGAIDAELRRLASARERSQADVARMTALADEARREEERTAALRAELAEAEASVASEADVAHALAEFDALWDSMTPIEQTRLMALLVARVEFDAADSSIEIAFHATGVKAVASGRYEEAA